MSDTNTVLVQASAVAMGRRALMIEGAPGSGKSTLALALIDRGAQLIGDDGVALSRREDRVIAAPPPRITGKLEIRNVGLVDMPTASAPLALILLLSDDTDRFRDVADMRDVLGIAVPVVPFTPGVIAPAVRAEWALRTHGLAIPPRSGD